MFYRFNAPGESVRDAFTRRLAVNDPSTRVYEHYFKELEVQPLECITSVYAQKECNQ